MRKTFCSTLLFLLFGSLGLQHLNAQVSYIASYHAQAGNPGNFNLESDQNENGWTTIMSAGLPQNQWSQQVTIPFFFAYYGRTVDKFRVSGNGLLSFLSNPQIPQGDNVKLPSGQLPDSTISCFWERFTTSAPTGSNDIVQTKIFGTAPYRQMWIRWTSFEWGSSNFQFVATVLQESTHDIYLVDMYGNQFGTPVTTSVGLQADAGFAVSYGDASTALNGISPSHLDNSYYEFNTYDIEPYDVDVVEILSPSSEGCGASDEQIQVRISNVGLLTASGIQASFSVDGAPFGTAETIPQSLASGEELDFTFAQRADFSTTGNHTLTVLLQLENDGNSNNNYQTKDVNSTLSVSSFPYVENFENGAGGWAAGGDNASWQLAYPNALLMQGAASGVKAWVTNPNGNYNNLENSYVSSPCFDLSSAHPDMHISMKVWWETEFSWDGAVLQATRNGGETWANVGGLDSSPGWYNDNTIGALPGDLPIGWTGTSAEGKGSGGWVMVQHPLGSELIGQPQVRFRIAFASDNAGFYEGFAFDDVLLAVPPQVDLGANRFFCEGDSLSIDLEQTNILWSNGSTSPYVQLFNPGSSPLIDSLVVATVTDANGLIGRDSIYISMTAAMQFTSATVEDIACAGETSGSISIGVNGGSNPLSYEWSHGPQATSLLELDTGNYTVFVQDLNGCQIDSTFRVQSNNSALNLAYTTSHAACDGSPIGSISLNASGGVGGYDYSWETGGEGSLRENLEAGNYIITTTDQLGCNRKDTIIVEQSGDLTINIDSTQNPSCIDAQDGIIQVNIEGGSGTYDIFWDHGATSQNIDLLSVGTYTGYVLDTDGCNKLLPEIQLEAENEAPVANFSFTISGSTIGFTDSSQHASRYSWDFGDGTATSREANPAHFYLNNNNYWVQLIVSNVCGSDTVRKFISLETVGLDKGFAAGVKISPNPFTDNILIQFESPSSEAYTLEVLNLQGQSIYKETGNKAELKHFLTLPNDMAKGIYLLRLSGRERQSVVRILKQ